MGDRNYKVTAMLDNDHSKWKSIGIKAKDEPTARKKAEKQLSKIAKTWSIDSVTEVDEDEWKHRNTY